MFTESASLISDRHIDPSLNENTLADYNLHGGSYVTAFLSQLDPVGIAMPGERISILRRMMALQPMPENFSDDLHDLRTLLKQYREGFVFFIGEFVELHG